MATLGLKNGVYHIRFRFRGRQFKKSLKTSDRADAQAAVHIVGQTIHRLTVGLLALPDGVEPGDFIVSGGTAQPTVRREPVGLVQAAREHLESQQHTTWPPAISTVSGPA